MPIKPEVLTELMKDYENPEDLLGPGGIMDQLKKALIEKAMEGEITHHLGYEKNDPSGDGTGNSRNGTYPKKVKSKSGGFSIEVPRDRNSTYSPQIIKKGQTRFDGFDDKIISMYARGMTTREIQGHLKEIYCTDVSPELISTVTSEVIKEVHAWQSRTLDPMYPIVYLDALRFKIRDNGTVLNKAVYLAIGVNMQGLKEVLGMWISENEGSKFWLKVMTELKNRGVNDILVACVDGLKGFPEAIEDIFPRTTVQLCIVHMVRNSLKYVSYKERKEIALDLKNIYKATTVEMAKQSLEEFSEKWDKKYPSISHSWRSNWERLVPFLDYPSDIRRVLYTTNAIESLNMTLRKTIKNRASFPNDDAALKLLYLSLQRIQEKWTMPIKEWGAAINQFAIQFEGRVELN